MFRLIFCKYTYLFVHFSTLFCNSLIIKTKVFLFGSVQYCTYIYGMKVEKQTINRWRKHAKVRGVIMQCHNKTKLSRRTIYAVLEKGEMTVGTFALMSKFFNQLDRKKSKEELCQD